VGLEPSVARYRLETIPEVAQFLMQIAQRRANT
jgi:hypothetical protein